MTNGNIDPSEITFWKRLRIFLNDNFVAGLVMAGVGAIICAIFTFVNWYMTSRINNRVDNIQNENSTAIPILATKMANYDSEINSINSRFDLLEKMVRSSNSNNSLTPLPTEAYSLPQWSVTNIEGFENDVEFDYVNNAIGINKDYIRSNNGYLYISLKEIDQIEFNLMITSFPTLMEDNGIHESSIDNYHIIIGVGENSKIEHNAINDNFIHAKIYPTYDYEKYRWKCCSVISESDILPMDELTTDISEIGINSLPHWKVINKDGFISIKINDDAISEEFSINEFSDPVLYIGYFQSEECNKDCPINFKICDIEPKIQ